MAKKRKTISRIRVKKINRIKKKESEPKKGKRKHKRKA